MPQTIIFEIKYGPLKIRLEFFHACVAQVYMWPDIVTRVAGAKSVSGQCTASRPRERCVRSFMKGSHFLYRFGLAYLFREMSSLARLKFMD